MIEREFGDNFITAAQAEGMIDYEDHYLEIEHEAPEWGQSLCDDILVNNYIAANLIINMKNITISHVGIVVTI